MSIAIKKYFLHSILIAFGIFVISCEEKVSVSPPVEPVPKGFIYIDSNPQGAKIYEDGLITGKVTPDSLPWLEVKEYNFTLKMNRYQDTSFSVAILEGEKKKIFIDYFSNPKMLGYISFTSIPNSVNIYLNDDYLGLTPLKLDSVVPGSYRIRYTKENCRSDSIVRDVISNFISDAHINLA